MSDKIVNDVLNSTNNREEVKPNRKQRKAFEKSYANAQKQHARMREDMAETSKKVMAPVVAQMEKDIANGSTDYSLYNMILQVADYSQCATALDSNRKTYEHIYPYIRRLSLRLRSVMETLKKYELTEKDAKYVADLEAELDLCPLKMARDVLAKEQERAKMRSKAGIKFYNS